MPQVSRSGRPIKKTFKMKELEGLSKIKYNEELESRSLRRKRRSSRSLRMHGIESLSEARSTTNNPSKELAEGLATKQRKEWNGVTRKISPSKKQYLGNDINRRLRSSRKKKVESGVTCKIRRSKRRKLKRITPTGSKNFKKFPSRAPKIRPELLRTDDSPRRQLRSPLLATPDSDGSDSEHTDAMDLANHLTLLGRYLFSFGEMVAGPDVCSALLDILVCSAGALLCLSRKEPELNGHTENMCRKVLEHIAYFMEDDEGSVVA